MCLKSPMMLASRWLPTPGLGCNAGLYVSSILNLRISTSESFLQAQSELLSLKQVQTNLQGLPSQRPAIYRDCYIPYSRMFSLADHLGVSGQPLSLGKTYRSHGLELRCTEKDVKSVLWKKTRRIAKCNRLFLFKWKFLQSSESSWMSHSVC
jgi:hypothetical protein